ncbi:MAG: UDP-N-acetylglucosamine--N-acetylmuramyl-(pentapeptide) pyrophosphoryl-undecaprenol N-acetylglucosamine transferase [Proteobacteria bacterium]|nr:UDP-N-acetylglucosamine--N-acetylmuramyl-(pentapeptide) pyrophosphoryl-undecaprenol N-acetylglucosamine transferase [Pseudomonadota bacterium]
MVKIALTGGGTAGHVMPHIALLPHYKKLGWEVFYIGSKGIEQELARQAGLDFYLIQTGKLRRYFSWENFLDVGRLLIGIFQSCLVLWRKRPSLVFCKGGFVSVPVALAAWLLRIPVVSHESDLTPGLANRLIKPFCSTIFYSFPETKRYLQGSQIVEAGIPVRAELMQGQKSEGARLCGFADSSKPTLLVMGGSMGAERINFCFAEILPNLLRNWRVVHLTGKGKLIGFSDPDYKAFEYVNQGLEHLFALADIVVCRAGANSLFELKALAKPMLLIPLEIASRGDQVENAMSFADQGWALILRETSMTPQSLLSAIEDLKRDAPRLQQGLANSPGGERTTLIIIDTLKKLLNQSK